VTTVFLLALSKLHRNAIELREQSTAGDRDVLMGEVFGEWGISGGNGVKDALVLDANIRRRPKSTGHHLTDAQLDLSHEKRVHALESEVVLSGHEGTMKGDVESGDLRFAIAERLDAPVRCESFCRDGSTLRQARHGSSLDDGARVEQINDIGSRENGNTGRGILLSPQQSLGHQLFDGHLGCWTSDAKAHGDR
jgi:hypothetical protein